MTLVPVQVLEALVAALEWAYKCQAMSSMFISLMRGVNASCIEHINVGITSKGHIYTLCSGVHVCWSEHSDSSFFYGFMSLDYGFGTMTATTYKIRSSKVTKLNEPAHDKTYKMACTHSEDLDQLGIRPVWSEYSLYARRKLVSLATSWAHSKDWLCWGLTTRQPLWVILCRLPEKGTKETEELKKKNREERGTGLKVKKQKK